MKINPFPLWRRLSLVSFLFLPLLLTGCSQSVEPEIRPRMSKVVTGDLTPLASQPPFYAWHPNFGGAYLPANVDGYEVLSQTHVVAEKVLREKGYLKVDPNQSPSFMISIALATESQVSDQEIVEEAGLVVGLVNDEADKEKYEKSTLLVGVFRPGHVDPVWRAVAQGVTEVEKLEQIPEDRMHELLTWMLDSLPSQALVQ